MQASHSSRHCHIRRQGTAAEETLNNRTQKRRGVPLDSAEQAMRTTQAHRHTTVRSTEDPVRANHTSATSRSEENAKAGDKQIH